MRTGRRVAPRKRRKQTAHSASLPYRLGRAQGYALGREHGYRLGRNQAIIQHIPVPVRSPKPISVLFVRSGLWAYRPIDDGIAAALARQTAQVHTALPQDDVTALAEACRPDLVLSLNSVELLDTSQIDRLRTLGFRTAVWFTDDPYYADVTRDVAPHYDHVFTNEEACVPLYEAGGCASVHYLPLAANTDLYHPQRVEPALCSEICFVGSAFHSRVGLFDGIADYLATKKTLIGGYWWERLRKYDQLAPFILNGVWISPEETSCWYNGAKLVINVHRAADDDANANRSGWPALSVNPRTFEIGAVGALQLVDKRPGLGRHYVAGEEVVEFSSPQELVELADYFLTHEQERLRIAGNALARTYREHTYDHRVQKLLDTVFP